MWTRFGKRLRCCLCKSALELFPFREIEGSVSAEHLSLAKSLDLLDQDFTRYVETGVLVCHVCKIWFPIICGLPVLLPYATPACRRLQAEFAPDLAHLGKDYQFPKQEPVSGERMVLQSFSTEWQEYDYDGVIWEMTYEEHEERFRSEVAFPMLWANNFDFLEIGCGLGITTYCAHAKYRGDAVGVDLSQAAFRAARHYKTNPFLHFAQASAFHLPFLEESFDVLYSRGVLHHTYSTHAAFRAIAKYCRPGGGLYLWVYGRGSIQETLFRKAAFAVETMTRPALSSTPDSWSSQAFLHCMALAYVAYNRWRRRGHRQIQALTFARAVHAARDRFTPRYAHRHSPEEVIAWFQEADFKDVEVVDWRTMPAADWDDYRRNVGVRGIRANGRKPLC